MSRECLWAPWRMEFLKKEKSTDCIFCTFPKETKDRENLIVYRGKESFIILNKYPYNSGHLMVVPTFHTADYEKVPGSALHEMNALIKQSINALQKAYSPQGFNLGMNIGEAAGAGIKDHLHFHIVPRWGGDTNFMPVIAETKCLPQHLEKTYDTLYSYLKEFGAP